MEKHSCATLHNVAQIKTLHCLVSFKHDKVSLCLLTMPVFPVVSSSYTATCFWCKSANIEALTLNPAIDNVVTKTHTAQWLEAPKTVFASDACFLPDCQLSMIQMQEYKFHGEWASHGDQEGKCQFWETSQVDVQPQWAQKSTKHNLIGFLTSQLITCHTLLQLDCTHQILAILFTKLLYK